MADIERFKKMNAQEKSQGKRVPWKERYAVVVEQFPSVETLDWERAFRDPELLGRVLRDILKADQAQGKQSGPGPRPVLDGAEGFERYRQLAGDDYAYVPFVEAFKALVGDRSIRHVSSITGINPTMVFKLLHGQREPDLYLMEEIASGFKKHPSFFMEYRVAYIIGSLAHFITKAPETTVSLYDRIRKAS